MIETTPKPSATGILARIAGALIVLGLSALFACGGPTALFRLRLVFGNSHDPVRTMREAAEYTDISFSPETRPIDGEIIDSLSSGSGILARVSVPKRDFPAFAHDPRFEGILRSGDAPVLAYSNALWPETRKLWGLPFTGRGVVGGREFFHAGFIAREEGDRYVVHLWEYH